MAARIDRFCADHRLMPGLAYAVNLAIDEILTSTITYGYEDRERHRIEVIVNLEPDLLVVVIVDDSMPFDLGLAPERDLDLGYCQVLWMRVESRAPSSLDPVA